MKQPQVFVLNGGEDTDHNDLSFASGYNKVVWGQAAKTVNAGATNSAGMTLVGENFAPGWDNTKGGTIFQQEFTAHKNINATIEANDGFANSVITNLNAYGLKPQYITSSGQYPTHHAMCYDLEHYTSSL